MYQINGAVLYILGTKTKKSDRQLRWFGKTRQEWGNLKAQEEPQTSKCLIIQSVA
jgi:hypothetical protein